MKYIHYFGTEAAYNQERNNNYIEPWLSYTEGRGLDYNIDSTKIPFTIEALGSGNITWTLGDKTVQYSKNGGTWEIMDSSTTVSVVEGDEVQFKGTNSEYYVGYNANNISTTMLFNVKGNIMSLTDGDEFSTANTVNANGFRGLFSGCTYLVSAGDLKLPATTLATYCYSSMFNGCSSLTAVPEELPATTLADYCYQNMFYGCSSLTTAPELPATTLAKSCYLKMFYNCSGLTTAPELTAMTLATNCYSGMFQGCSSLTQAPELPATTLTASCYNGMFQKCTSLTTAPELPATTLATYCYDNMFNGCSSLNRIKAMFTTTPSSTYTSNWVKGVASTGTFVKNAAAAWTTTGVHGIPTGWTVQTAAE